MKNIEHNNLFEVIAPNSDVAGDNYLSQSKGTPLKITIPDELSDDLASFSAGYNTSKSEVVRNSLYQYLNNDFRWLNRRFFFKPRKKRVTLSNLQNCNGFVKIASLNKDLPSNSYNHIVKLLRFDDNESIISFSLDGLPYAPMPSQVLPSDIYLGPGNLVMPIIDTSHGLDKSPLIYYKINNDYLWVCNS